MIRGKESEAVSELSSLSLMASQCSLEGIFREFGGYFSDKKERIQEKEVRKAITIGSMEETTEETYRGI